MRVPHIIRMTLSEWMTAKRLKDREVAVLLGIHRSTVSRVRRGKHLPSRALISAMVATSDGAIDAHTLLGESEERA